MKKLLFASLFAACFCFIAYTPSQAVTALELDGNSYAVTIFCADDVGDYCSQGKTSKDTLSFEDGGFSLGSFDDDDWLGFGDTGEYSESGVSFDADYEILNQDVEKYTFHIKGVNLIDRIIAGSMEITYSNKNIFDDDAEDQKGSAYFFGMKD